MSSIGEKLKITIFGESHADCIGVDISSFPKGVKIDMDEVYLQMARRAPGDPSIGTARKEPDRPEILSGIENGVTTGDEIKMIIKNKNQHSKDYDNLKVVPRPGHADYTAFVKYKGNADMRGGGKFSGRLTAPLVFAGALCRQLLLQKGIFIGAHAFKIGNVKDEPFDEVLDNKEQIISLSRETFPVISKEAKDKMLLEMAQARENLDSIGGVVECKVIGLPAGIGGPLFEGVEGKLSQYIFGIPAVKGLEFGAGFGSASLKGSQNNDDFAICDGKIVTTTNNAGGILGGITNGMPLTLKVAFKPTPSIAKAQKSVDLQAYEEQILEIKGRHDPCVVPRAVPCVESAVAVALCDMLIEEGII